MQSRSQQVEANMTDEADNRPGTQPPPGASAARSSSSPFVREDLERLLRRIERGEISAGEARRSLQAGAGTAWADTRPMFERFVEAVSTDFADRMLGLEHRLLERLESIERSHAAERTAQRSGFVLVEDEDGAPLPEEQQPRPLEVPSPETRAAIRRRRDARELSRSIDRAGEMLRCEPGDTERDALIRELERIREQRDALAEENDRLTREAEGLRDGITKARQRFEAAEQRTGKLAESRDAIEERSRAVRFERDSLRIDLEAEREHTARRAIEHAEEVAKLRAERDRLLGMAPPANRAAAADVRHASEAEALRLALDDAARDVVTARSERDAMVKREALNLEERDKFKLERDALRLELVRAREALGSSVYDVCDAIRAAIAERNKLRKDVEHWRHELGKISSNVEGLREQRDRAERLLETRTAERDGVLKDCQGLRRELAEVTEHRTTLTDELKAEKARASELWKEKTEYLEELDRLRRGGPDWIPGPRPPASEEERNRWLERVSTHGLKHDPVAVLEDRVRALGLELLARVRNIEDPVGRREPTDIRAELDAILSFEAPDRRSGR